MITEKAIQATYLTTFFWGLRRIMIKRKIYAINVYFKRI